MALSRRLRTRRIGAVTLATEASNGTLNSSQVTAADSGYQKILTETDTINNNTEYNGSNTMVEGVHNVF